MNLDETPDLDITDATTWPALMTVEEVACAMRIQAPTVRLWVREGLLLPVHPELSARAYRFDREYILGRRHQCSFPVSPDVELTSRAPIGAEPGTTVLTGPALGDPTQSLPTAQSLAAAQSLPTAQPLASSSQL